MDLVKLCLSPFCSCMQSPVVRQDMSNVLHTKENLDDLKNAKEALMAKMRDIQRELVDPNHRGKLLSDELQLWLRNVREKENKVEQLLDEYGKGNCVPGSCSLNCFSRYNISRDAIRLKAEITTLKAEQPKVSFIKQRSPKPVPESYITVGKTIGSNHDIACGYLADETVGIVGIWGMGGVGKTTLLKKIYQSLLDDATLGFDHVLFIEASQNIQLVKLREEIAKKLRLDSSASKEVIFDALKRKNFVLLLDNIWEEVDLIDLGIPHPYSDNISTKQYKHKVIFSTRFEDVCAKMGAGEKTIEVECLEPDEAWDLFKHTVNLHVIESNAKIKEIAWQVMQKCDGLPLALKVVGKAMSNRKNIQDWESTLNSLKNSGALKVQGVEESLLPILKFSYDVLPKNIQECFLCFSMLRESSKRSSKEDLLNCWMGFGLISDFVNLQQAYSQARNIFNTLEESCLLYFNGSDYVYLHDVIYEMIVWIASNSGMNMNKWIVKDYHNLAGEIPSTDVENWRSANRVILKSISHLPILSHQCPDLLCLMIIHNDMLEKVPKGFFSQMPNLTYLDLSGTAIKELPRDIKCLVNLQYLNISRTWISSLPKELVYLTKLQYLLCKRMGTLSKVEDGLMSRLHKLKIIDLYPFGCVQLEELKLLKKHIKGIGMRVVSQEVLQQLSCLPTTCLCLHKLDELTSLSFDTLSCRDHGFLQELEISSCPEIEELVMNGNKTPLNHLSISGSEKLQKIIWPALSPPKFFHMLKEFETDDCNLASLAWVLHLPCLFALRICRSPQIETLFYVNEEEREIHQVSEGLPTFPALQVLFLNNLPKLVSISNVTLDFPQLTHLYISNCIEIETLFYVKTEEREIKQAECLPKIFPALYSLELRNLPKLVSISNVTLDFPELFYLDISDCAEIETLFYVKMEEREVQQAECLPTMFPALHTLYLSDITKLVSISNVALDFPQLRELRVRRCPNLKKLLFKDGINNNQRKIGIDCERGWWESLEWDDAIIPSHLQPCFYMDENPDECATSGK